MRKERPRENERTHLRSRPGIALSHPRGQLDVRLLVLVVLGLAPEPERVLGALVQRLGDDQAGDVHLVLEEVGDLGLDVVDRPRHVP